jgi:exosortase
MTVFKRASVPDRWFFSLVLASVALFWKDFVGLVLFSFANDLYSYIVLIPVVSVALILREKRVIFADVAWWLWPGIGLVAVGLAGTALERRVWPVGPAASLGPNVLCALLMIVGAFVLCYGKKAVRSAVFPILFLFLTVPIPERVLDGVSALLERASYELTYGMLATTGVPVLRHGFTLSLPAGGIFIGPECSGIHSTLGLLFGGLVAGHLFLRPMWKKAVLCACIVPVSIFKNALRIISLYWLGVHTDKHFLTGELHRRGGIPFSLVAVAILGALVWVLRMSDSDNAATKRNKVPVSALMLEPAQRSMGK